MTSERSLRRQVAKTISAAIVAVMAAGMALSVVLLKRAVEQRFDGRLAAAAAQLQTAVTRTPERGLAIDDGPGDPAFEERGSGWGWVVREGQRVIARSRSMAADPRQAGPPLGGFNEIHVVETEGGSIRAVTVRLRGSEDLSATVFAPQQAVWAEIQTDAAIVIGAIAALAVLLVAVAWTQTRRALTPVEQLAATLQRLKSGEVSSLPPSSYRELDAVTRLINDLVAERRTALDEAKDRAARLAHGLKTPLAVLAARFGASGATPDARVVAAVEGMNRMIRLNLADARAGRASAIRPEPIPLRPIVADLVAAFRHALKRPDLVVSCSLSDAARAPLSADDAQEVFGNLLENAFRHAATRLDVAELPDGGVAISNDGAAFPPEVLEAAASPDHAGPDPGGGLGLDIARRILALNGGVLGIANTPDGRAVATVRFSAG